MSRICKKVDGVLELVWLTSLTGKSTAQPKYDKYRAIIHPNNNILYLHLDTALTCVIIHSKYFPDSDWLKEHV